MSWNKPARGWTARKKAASWLLLVLVAGLPVAYAPAQTTRHVPAQYKSIQAGIDAAKTGDTVLVAPGTYFESLIIGKSITLRSAAGPHASVIDASRQAKPVIDVRTASTIDGFTVQNGVAWGLLFTPAYGGGIRAVGGSVIRNNIIRANTASSTSTPAYGGGLHVSGALVVNNVIAFNSASSSKQVAQGGGIHASGATLIHNTVYGNQAATAGGGIFAATATTVVNCIVAANQGGDLSGSVTATTCHTGEPFCVDWVNGDVHLRYDSPCRDKGTRVAGLPTTDFEGDPRIHGSAPDIGADEFHPRVYVTGTANPGGLVLVKMIGAPGHAVLWAVSLHPTLLNPPITIPSVGLFYLQPPFVVMPGTKIVPLGVAVVPIQLSPAMPKPMDLPIQALIGTGLSNPFVLRIR